KVTSAMLGWTGMGPASQVIGSSSPEPPSEPTATARRWQEVLGHSEGLPLLATAVRLQEPAWRLRCSFGASRASRTAHLLRSQAHRIVFKLQQIEESQDEPAATAHGNWRSRSRRYPAIYTGEATVRMAMSPLRRTFLLD